MHIRFPSSLSAGAAFVLMAGLLFVPALSEAEEPLTLDLWPATPPGDEGRAALPPEADLTKPEDGLVGGRRIIKLGNVTTPQLAVHRPAPEKANGAAVIVCPGGGFHILAYDLEGTEVAEWLNGLGITAVVLKYRVPFRDEEKKWLAAAQDCQRAVSLVRSKAAEWKLDGKRIGVLGFSAGGHTAGRAALFHDSRLYEAADEADQASPRPDFAVLVYPAWFADDKSGEFREGLALAQGAPPAFFVHAFDDPVSALSSLRTATEMKKAGALAEVHVYAEGGHGYGLRHVDGMPVTDWPKPCEDWLRAIKVLPK